MTGVGCFSFAMMGGTGNESMRIDVASLWADTELLPSHSVFQSLISFTFNDTCSFWI